MHQTDRVLRQFGFRQSIPEEPNVLDEQQKINLQLTNMNWSLFWSKYIKIWENQYYYILDRELIIVPELACIPDYMSWFRIHGKPYLLLKEQRRKDDGTDPSTAPTQSSGPSIVPTQSQGLMPQPTTPTSQPLQIMPVLCSLEYMARCISFPNDSDSTDDIWAIIAGGIARGTVNELISLPFPIAIWNSNTSAVGDANTSRFYILPRWVILPTPTTGATITPAGATITLTRATKKESNA
ncbi:hypothetical protein PVK06_048243 [Gossypium arboreum]|uniref:Aminotransferase-like plant mobile domain-containing protein n=1 Tax=Gossypium arboreum TaxID=29729 RepID=A0ABR0MFJ6_GOSAR|nr:hypothetical protein PVK06_048243 [Gossypium arboreum]